MYLCREKKQLFLPFIHKWYFLKQILIKCYQIRRWIPFVLFRKEDQNKGTVWRYRQHKVVWIKGEFNNVLTVQDIYRRKSNMKHHNALKSECRSKCHCHLSWVHLFISGSSWRPVSLLYSLKMYRSFWSIWGAQIKMVIVIQSHILGSCHWNLLFFPLKTSICRAQYYWMRNSKYKYSIQTSVHSSSLSCL